MPLVLPFIPGYSPNERFCTMYVLNEERLDQILNDIMQPVSPSERVRVRFNEGSTVVEIDIADLFEPYELNGVWRRLVRWVVAGSLEAGFGILTPLLQERPGWRPWKSRADFHLLEVKVSDIIDAIEHTRALAER